MYFKRSKSLITHENLFPVPLWSGSRFVHLYTGSSLHRLNQAVTDWDRKSRYYTGSSTVSLFISSVKFCECFDRLRPSLQYSGTQTEQQPDKKIHVFRTSTE